MAQTVLSCGNCMQLDIPQDKPYFTNHNPTLRMGTWFATSGHVVIF